MSGSQQRTRTRTLWREGGGPHKREEWGSHHSPRQKPSEGRRGRGREVDNDFSDIKVSIAGGVEEIVRV